MTQTVPSTQGSAPLANALIGQQRQLAGLNAQQTTYVIDPKTGNCVFVMGADISMVPEDTFSASPSMVSTGLTGAGAASKKTGAWVQL